MPRRRKADFNEAHYRELLQRSGVALIVSRGVELKVELVNDTFTRLFGYTVEDVPDVAHWWPLAYPDEKYRDAIKSDWERRVANAIANQNAIEPMEAKVRCKDGSERYIEFHFSSLGDTSIVSFVDLTERKRAEMRSRESEERLRLAAQLGGMFAYSWDATTDVIKRSGESVQILGIRSEKLSTGTAVSALVHPDDKERLEAALANLTIENPRLRITYRIVRPDGVVKWLERNSRAYFDASGNVVRMVGMVVDVTERKLIEENLANMARKLIEAQEKERARIGRELHDDINQRLAILILELEHLQNDPANLQNRLRELQNDTLELSNDVQALSHELHASKLEYLGVVAGIKSWCKEFGQRHRLEIEFKTEVSTVLPRDVGICLLRVLQEALHNAVKHSGVKRIEVRLSEDSNAVNLVVHDSGKGFDVKAALQGQGLGLTSMDERIRLVNGTLTIQSNEGNGTTIHARVPLTSEHTSQKATG